MDTGVRTSLSLVLAIFVIVQVSVVRGQAKFQCKGHEISISKQQLDGMKACAEKVGVKSLEEMTPDKIPCLAKCIMETTGLIDAEGKPHKENIMRDIDASVPDDMKAIYKTATEKCIDDHGANISPKDTTCLSYNPLAMCVTKAFKSICQV